MAQFCLENRDLIATLGSAKRIRKDILREAQYGRHEFLYIAASCYFQRIHLFKQQVSWKLADTFENEIGHNRNPPLYILFSGPIDNGHFTALIPREPQAPVATGNSAANGGPQSQGQPPAPNQGAPSSQNAQSSSSSQALSASSQQSP